MKLNNTVLVVVVLTIVISVATYFFFKPLAATAPTQDPIATTPTPLNITYSNAALGFNFLLPQSWNKYTVIEEVWEGNSLIKTDTKQSGVKLVIRNPNWTTEIPYEDIPVLVLTLEQWNSYTNEDFAIGAAPFKAQELDRNNVYVFALPARWNYDYNQDFEGAEKIIKSHPLQAYNISIGAAGRLNTNLICERSLSYMSFPDAAQAQAFVEECKQGKYPEVIENYRIQMNVPEGAAI